MLKSFIQLGDGEIALSPFIVEVKCVNDNYGMRAKELGKYIAETKSTVRATARHFGISKSTVHTDVSLRLRELDCELFEKVRAVLDENKAQRHVRGGKATKEKYKRLKKQGSCGKTECD